MEFPTKVEIDLSKLGIHGTTPKSINIHSGITTFLGPNGSGKTQLLRGLKSAVGMIVSWEKVRYVSSGRLGPLEAYRSDYDGQRGGQPGYEDATYGNKKSMARRHKSETVLGDFATLSERPDILIKVQERLKKLFNRDLRIDWDEGRLKVYFSRVDVASSEYSSAREASGLLHLVAILATLYDDEVDCILIDEPEVSLHPQLQSFVYQEMLKVAGDPEDKGKKLIFISTHSTEFVHIQSVENLASIVFCSDIYDDLVQIDPTLEEFKSRKIRTLLSRMGQEHKLALFCKRPLLVEGPSDQIICSGLNIQLDLNIEAAGSQILPIIGKGQMPTVIKLMRLIGKIPCVLADADGLADGTDLITSFTNTKSASEIATKAGHKNASKFAQNVYSDFSQLVIKHWDDIGHLAEKHRYWINKDSDSNELIAKKRAAFSTLLNLEQQSIQRLDNPDSWNRIKTRLVSLLELLNSLGCFILTKGTIEDYYIRADTNGRDEKPNKAIHEISYFSEAKDDDLRSTYADIIKAVEFAAQAKEIDERAAIREMVLAVAAPALATLKADTTSNQLHVSSKSLLGNKANLFKLEVDNTDGLHLVVDLKTSILDVKEFPLRIPVGADLIRSVNTKMNFK